jgi:single-stranded-DNA-specific exonuclease recJ
MNKKWHIYETDEAEINKISKMYNINKLLASILINRKVKDIELYLKPTRKNFHDPFLMPDMEIAVDRIIKAINNQEKIIIYGDYDVDGITSITVLKSFLEDRGLHVDSYIPNRLQEGYGLNKPAIDEIVKNKYDLMITVDCGISGIEEIKYANSLGLETIVTDHHEVGEVLPKAIAVVDAKRKDNKYPCRDLAGVGVVFKLTQALRNKVRIR